MFVHRFFAIKNEKKLQRLIRISSLEQ